MKDKIKVSFQETQTAINNFTDFEKIAEIGLAMEQILNKGGKLMVCGNGGSACQAMHFAEELTGRYRKDRRALPAISLTDASHITCVGNDYGFENIFSRAVEAYGKPGDGLLVLSTSGNSENLIRAVDVAKKMEIKTFALLGKGGGRLKGMSDYDLVFEGQTSDVVQNMHMIAIHLLIEATERQLFPEIY
jgi:D-sedoheptulose 7-phosphate isomerase